MMRNADMGRTDRRAGGWRAAMAAAAAACVTLACAQMQDTQPASPAAPLASQGPPPPWAYMIQPAVTPPPDDGIPKHVPGSNVGLTLTDIRNLFVPPDWHPDDHPRMPGIVGTGRKPDAFACGYCHYPNGHGRPENASLAGLSAGYIAQQLADYRSGSRKSSDPNMRPPALMIDSAKAVTDEDIRISAEYFASVKYLPWVRVVETDTVPTTRVSGFMLVPIDGGAVEPIGQRIIEVAEDAQRTALRDARSGFVAYVPAGSIRKGELLVTGNHGKTTACAACHGADLRGRGDVPPLAGRSPTYTVRQLYDFQSGARAGQSSAQMKEAVARLTLDDMVSIAAYTASLKP